MAEKKDLDILTQKKITAPGPVLGDYKFTVLWKDDIMADVELFGRRRQVRIIKYKNTFPENPFYGGAGTF